MDAAIGQKQEGNAAFVKREYGEAISRYEAALKAIGGIEGGILGSQEAFVLAATVRSNLAAALLGHGKPLDALAVCDAALGALAPGRAALAGKLAQAVESLAGEEGAEAKRQTLWLLPPPLMAKILHRRAKARLAAAIEGRPKDESSVSATAAYAAMTMGHLTDAAADCDAACSIAGVAGLKDDVAAIAATRQALPGTDEGGFGLLDAKAAKMLHPLATWRMAAGWRMGFALEAAPGPTLAAVRGAGVVADALLTRLDDETPGEAEDRVAIPAGDTVLRDMPVLVAKNADEAVALVVRALRDEEGGGQRSSLRRAALVHLGCLRRGSSALSGDPVDLAKALWQMLASDGHTYEFRMDCKDDEPSERGWALHAALPFVEHSCNPNCVVRRNAVTGLSSLVAIRDISFGERFTVAVIHPLSSPAAKARLFLTGSPAPRCPCIDCRGGGSIAEHADAVCCPFCSATAAPLLHAEGEAANGDGPSDNVHTSCSRCGKRIPVADYTARVAQKIQEAGRMAASGNAMDAARMLVAVNDGAKMLGPAHRLRFHTALTALSAGYGAVARDSHVGALAGMCTLAHAVSHDLMPPLWPETTGLRMHGAFLEAIRARLKHHTDGADSDFTVADFCRCNRSGLAKAYAAMCDAFEQHGKLVGKPDDLPGFLERFATEFEAMGATTLPELQEFMTMARDADAV